jgi:PAS domain S-box/diguanylate cyclase (GGDEF) domain
VNSTLTAYIAIVCVSGVVNMLLAVHVVANRKSYGKIAAYFTLGVGAMAVYCFAYAFSLTSSTLEQLRFWSVMQYFGMPFAPTFSLLFVLHYLGYKLSGWRIAAWLAIPSLSLLSNATNEWHHLHYKEYNIHELRGAPYNDIEVGPTYIIMGCFILVCLLGSIVLLLSRWRDTDRAYRPQLVSVALANAVPMSVSFLYLVGVTPEGIDPVPMVCGISALLMWWTIESSRLLTIVPVAKEVIFHSISDGVIVLDQRGRLVEYNESCGRMFGRLDRTMLGRPLEEVWPAMFGASASVPSSKPEPQDLEVAADDEENRVYQVRVSKLQQNVKRGIPGTVMIISDVTELKQMQKKLEEHAYRDDLTQIFNRRAFFERCEEAFARARRNDAPFTTILFDIDHFKVVNDVYGHHAGDQALVHVVRICKEQLKDGMLFARYGGEEFVLALYGQTAEYGRAFAERLRGRIASAPLVVDGKTIRITSSFGVAEASGHAAESLQQLLRFSDEALYEAKRNGRNRVCAHQADPV